MVAESSGLVRYTLPDLRLTSQLLQIPGPEGTGPAGIAAPPPSSYETYGVVTRGNGQARATAARMGSNHSMGTYL